MVRHFLTILVCSLPAVLVAAPQPDVWGKPPAASDDRFTNPDKPLYAGPHGWWNTGEVRAKGAAGLFFRFKASFSENTGTFLAANDLLTLAMDFGTEGRPEPGDYKIGAKGDPATKTVRFAFSDVSEARVREWASGADAGMLTVTRVHGFTVFTCRGVVMKATTASAGESDAPIVLGFEGALSPG